jgi:hypothetical protein
MLYPLAFLSYMAVAPPSHHFYESVTNKPNHHDHLSSDKNQIATALIFMPQPLEKIREKRKGDKRLIN